MMLMSRGNRKLIYPDVLQMFKIGIIASFSWEMSNFFKASMRAVQWIFSLFLDPAKWGRANKQPNNKRKYHNIPVSCLLVSSEIKSIYCWPASANIYSIFYVTYLFIFAPSLWPVNMLQKEKNILKACMESSPEATRVTSWIWSQSQTFGLGCSWTLTVSHTNTVTDTFCAWFKQQF